MPGGLSPNRVEDGTHLHNLPQQAPACSPASRPSRRGAGRADPAQPVQRHRRGRQASRSGDSPGLSLGGKRSAQATANAKAATVCGRPSQVRRLHSVKRFANDSINVVLSNHGRDQAIFAAKRPWPIPSGWVFPRPGSRRPEGLTPSVLADQLGGGPQLPVLPPERTGPCRTGHHRAAGAA